MKHLAIIMDGNGRWAKERGMARTKGHVEGSKTLKKLVKHCVKKGIKVLSVFAFSTENFNRTKDEVDFLMELFQKVFKNEFKELKENNIRIVISGNMTFLPNKLVNIINQLEENTKNNTGLIFNICLSYGGRLEIVDAVKKMIKENVKEDDVTEELISKYLYHDLPDVDLLIRTSGEIRISNFMLYKIAYAEMYFTSTYFPDFNEEELDKALEEFNTRKRRFGKN